MLDSFMLGFMDAITISNLFFIILGVGLGVVAGAIPGVNGPMAIALCIPLSYYMSPVPAISFLVGLNKGSFFGGSISSVLLNTPGTPESAATSWDGYPLTQQGLGEKALRIALFSSVTGDAFATIVLILVAAPLAVLALYMGPPEIFTLICLATTIVAGLGTKSIAKGLIATFAGVIVATIGTEPVSALPRLTFGIFELEQGIALIPIGIGMLAFAEILDQFENKVRTNYEEENACPPPGGEECKVSLKEYLSTFVTLIRSSIAGTIVGALPGLGAPVASFFAYDRARKSSKNPESFGKGNIEGIAASEAANSAVVASSLIPLFTLGIPGNVAAALLIGAFVVHGMVPGPLMFEQNAQFLYSIYTSLIIANIALLVIGIMGIKSFCRIVQVPFKVLYPIIFFTCLMGAYLTQYALFDITLVLFFACLAYIMRKFDFPVVCFLIGFILTPTWETTLQQVVIASELDPMMFFKRPVAMILLAITFFIIGKTSFSTFKNK